MEEIPPIYRTESEVLVNLKLLLVTVINLKSRFVMVRVKIVAMQKFSCFGFVVVSIVITNSTGLVGGTTIDARTINAAANRDGSVSGDVTPNRVLHELDMMLTADQYYAIKDELKKSKSPKSNHRNKRKAINSMTSLWPNKVVPYNITDGIFTYSETEKIYEAMDEWRNLTCIQFRDATDDDVQFVRIISDDGCWSSIGHLTEGKNKLSLGKGCRSKDIILHEIGHTIGFYHEHSRPDRDDYVSVLFDNVNKSHSHNFEKKRWSQVLTYGLPYDYDSIMHYDEKTFSVNNTLTVHAKDPKYQKVIGNGKGLSFSDIKLANLMYSCSERCPDVKCPGQGFLGKDCKCWCPGQPVQQCDEVVATTFIPLTATVPECSDRSTHCPAFVRSGQCRNRELARKFCKMSCKICNKTNRKVCSDTHAACKAMQILGYCSHRYFAGSMAKQCPQSCNLCTA
ncbi:Blastula protease 10 [Bulinus truncatus]|nr:Blastula protease 10 [Bulinus truncatus]